MDDDERDDGQPDGGTNGEGADPGSAPGHLSLLQVVTSVLAAGLGVQSSRQRERDFRRGRPLPFILAGLLFTALFIGAVVLVVKLVVAGAR